MKTALKLALVIFTTSIVLIGCKKDNDPAAIVGTWTPEKIALKEIAFSDKVSSITQGLISVAINQIINEGVLNDMVNFSQGKLEFRENG